MAEETVEIRKYLDLAGLKLLWQKISEKYPRTDNLATILDALEDPYIHKSLYDADITELEQKIQEIEASTGNTMDGDTIIRNKETNKLQTNLILDLDHDKQTIRLVTKDPESEVAKAKTVISEIDYTPFVKDGILDSVSIVVVPEDETEQTSGKAPGTYLKFIFNTDAGKEAIYLDASEFVNVYKGDDYISIVGDQVTLETAKLDEWMGSERCATITAIKTDIRVLQTNTAEISAKIETVSAKVEEFDSRITTLEQTSAEHTEQIQGVLEVLETVPTEPISDTEINELP